MTPFYITLTILTVLIHFIFVGSAIYALRKKKRFIPIDFDHTVNPKCSVILPCKGDNRELEKNLSSFLKLDYDNYEVIFTIESETDSALPVIQRVIDGHDNARVVVAGLATSCGQKNLNLVKAVDTITDSDILIFADSDIRLFPHWITSITAPIVAKKATAVTGFRWLYSTSRRMGDLAHSLQNFLLYSFFVTAAHKQDKGLWGGSMAIKKDDYERLGVRDVWLKTSVDDMSLSGIVNRAKEKTVFAYDCITPTSDTIRSFREATRWFQRQVMYLKYHLKAEWFVSITVASFVLFLNLLFPYAVIQQLCGGSFLFDGGIVWIVHIAMTVWFSFFFPRFGEKGKIINFIFASPISFISASIGTVNTIFTNTIEWSGTSYKVRYRDGVVTKVERKPKEN